MLCNFYLDKTELSQNNNTVDVASDRKRLSLLCCQDKRDEAVQCHSALQVFTHYIKPVMYLLLPEASEHTVCGIQKSKCRKIADMYTVGAC